MNQMKCSVSMTSLESPQSNLRTPEGQQKKPWPGGRHSCSLNAKKPRRTLDKKMWRRSWGSNNEDSSQEEFWRICQQSVQELVEANSEEQGLRHFLENYGDICEWLNSMQIERGRFLDAIKLSELANDMVGRHHWRVEVNEIAKSLSQKYPNLKEEFQWRLKHLNSQWDALEKILSRHKSTMDADSTVTPNNEGKDCDLDWVRDWLRQKESELQPLDFRTEWTQQLLEREIGRYKAIQAEIEEKASSIHGVLRQCQSRGRPFSSASFATPKPIVRVHQQASNNKENSKRSRLETRWLQLRLRVLEWVQHLSGVAERQRNLKKGRRSDIYYSASNWDSDGDNNEPLRKCPRFDDGILDIVEGNVPDPIATCETDLSSSEDIGNFLENPKELLKQQHRFSDSSLRSPRKVSENLQDQYHIGNRRQSAEQLVSSPSSSPSGYSLSQRLYHYYHKEDDVLLLNHQQQQQLPRKTRGHQDCQQQHGSVVSVTLDEVDCDMGQSHDSENVFSQSEPQFPNSVVEFTFDGSQCVGMKRKLSSPSASPPLTPSSALHHQQVVPRNISIYYFKHSDTEPEPNNQQSNNSGNTNINDSNRGNHHQCSTVTTTTSTSTKSPLQNRRASRTHCENSATQQTPSDCKLANCTCVRSSRGSITTSVNSNRKANRHYVCQKSRLFLDLDQEFEDDITSLKSYDEISFGSFDLDLDDDLEEDPVAEATVQDFVGEQVPGDVLHHHQLNQSEQDHFSIMDLEENDPVAHRETSGSTTDLPSSVDHREQKNNSFNRNISNNIDSNSNSTSNDAAAANTNSNKPVVSLDEIEELVQKAELLVQQTTRSRGVDCVDLPVQVGSSEEEDDETLMLPQKHCADHHHHHVHHYHQHHNHHHHNHLYQQHDVMMIAPTTLKSNGGSRVCGGSSNGEIAKSKTNGSEHGSQELLHPSSPSASTSIQTFSVRKCSVSSGLSSSSSTSAHKFVKSPRSSTTLSSLSSWSATTNSVASVASNGGSIHTTSFNGNNIAMSSSPKGSFVTSTLGNMSGGANNGGVGESDNTAAPVANCSGTGITNTTVTSPSNAVVTKTSKKSARVRQWIRAHNSEIVVNQKNTSSCDASAESASDSEYSSTSGSDHPVSSDDPTTVSTSTFLHQTHAALLETSVKTLSSCSSTTNIFGSGTLNYCIGAAAALSLSPSSVKSHKSPIASSSDAGNQTITPFSVALPSNSGTVPLRSKKRLTYGKQRPKSFTDTLEATPSIPANGPNAYTANGAWLRTSPSCFVSDSAINLLGNQGSCSEGSGSSSTGDSACSPENTNVDSPSHAKKKGSRLKRRPQKGKKKVQQVDEAISGDGSILRSSSFTESACGPVTAEKHQPSDGADQSSDVKSSPKPNFLISGPLSHQPFSRLSSENGSSMNTEELNIGLNDQADWDSYQEKYLSEPYSEEPYDPDGTLKLLAFGEDYGQYLDRADSESSSMLSGFEPTESRKRRPLALANREEMADSDSDREELNYLLRHSKAQLRFIEVVLKGLLSKPENTGDTPAKYAEMEATCDENISLLKLILSNVEESGNLPFEIDLKSVEADLEKWHIVKEKIRQAANIHHIKEEMGDLKMDFSNVHSLFCTCKQLDITDMESLKEKIRSIEDVLTELPSRKLQLQNLNDASLKTQVFLEDQESVGIIKQQLNELYVLYEDNLQLGTFLLEKMRYLQDAWEQFEKEKQDFEKSVSVSNLRSKLRKEFSSSASTDSGHGTDFSHDSSISDSDMEFQERHKKLVALKERAKKVKAFLPPGSPVFDLLDQSVEEAEKGLSSLKHADRTNEIIDLKSLYPRKKPLIYSRRSSGQKSPKSKLLTPPPRRISRKWTVVRRMVMFNVALMGIFLAAAYFLHPKCCEFTNTFCFSLVPHLTHESLPPI